MPEKALIIGHRGAAALLPENTLDSFRAAFEDFKADGIEFDVHFSADKIPVIIHDATLERTTNGRGFVSRQTFQQLQKLDAGKGARIPSLEEVLVLFKTKTLFVEIKERSAELVHSVMALIERYKADKCVVGSKHFLVSATLRKHYPGQARFLSQREIVQNFIASRVSLTPNFTDALSVASMPLKGCGMPFDDPRFLAWLHQKKIRIFFWTINDPGEMKRLLSAGADGIITDRPGQ